jgi:cell division protease FtsH
MSDETAKLVDSEIRSLVEDGEQTARRVLTEHVDDLHLLAKALLEYETLNGDEVVKVLRGEPITRDTRDEGPTGPAVPVAGKAKPNRGEEPSGGMEPQPQV